MVKRPDYIYGIVADRGEYGFEQQPESPPPSELARVQSLASRFQWAGDALAGAIAIAVETTGSPLVTQYTTDPRDPAGRSSMQMKVWVCASQDEADDLTRCLWPNEVGLPIGYEEFLAEVGHRPEGSLIIGPTDQFTGVGFDRDWGAIKSRGNPTITRRVPSTFTTQNHRRSNRGWSPIKWISLAALLLVSTVSLGVVVVKQRYELDQSRAKQSQLTDSVQEVKGANAQLKDRLNKLKNAARKNSAEIVSLKQKNQGQNAEFKRRLQIVEGQNAEYKRRLQIVEGQNAEYKRRLQIVDGNPEKVD